MLAQSSQPGRRELGTSNAEHHLTASSTLLINLQLGYYVSVFCWFYFPYFFGFDGLGSGRDRRKEERKLGKNQRKKERTKDRTKKHKRKHDSKKVKNQITRETKKDKKDIHTVRSRKQEAPKIKK